MRRSDKGHTFIKNTAFKVFRQPMHDAVKDFTSNSPHLPRRHRDIMPGIKKPGTAVCRA